MGEGTSREGCPNRNSVRNGGEILESLPQHELRQGQHYCHLFILLQSQSSPEHARCHQGMNKSESVGFHHVFR
jgi:hypothetical protein